MRLDASVRLFVAHHHHRGFGCGASDGFYTRNLSPLLLPGAQGRFSGRLASKMDEKRLVIECRKLGPLLGGVTKCGGIAGSRSRARAWNPCRYCAWVLCEPF